MAFSADLWRIMENDKGRLGKKITVGCCWEKEGKMQVAILYMDTEAMVIRITLVSATLHGR